MPEHLSSTEDFFALAERVDNNARVRVVTGDSDASRLEPDPEAVVGAISSPGQQFLGGVVLCAVSVLAVYVITFNAWDEDGFFPWYWNVVWTLFPWFFLTPVWLGYAKSLRRQACARRFAAGFEEFRARAVRVAGTVENVHVMTSESGRVIRLAAEIGCGAQGPLVVLTTQISLLQTEVPKVGAPAHVWIGPDQQTKVVQIASGVAEPPEPGADVVDSSAMLAELHSSGALSDEEYQKAKQRLLG
ncbi:Short C-terminal domain-containing protein [Saccharopolyspora kobensis]|uniref:Short C-terminal domain-containing protein n=1 Tax=Saccharopolyspora kobensis TaxID=146035 RepID=A0A1H5ZN66_9PSEU|nr:SHOCT domain-containing protein [Saccharopolyspora kobensis]SEG36836.1 Short C-terminal domain-containing protein [Saccharopolyspora kobensis]SFF20782.1 Short C-terminal domain-containing protein [Saccharopolyspora kobensis]